MSLAPIIIGLLSIVLPGFFLSLALLRKTGMGLFEISAIGFLFGLIFPPSMTWAEGYLIQYIHAFSFSANLYIANVVILTILGIVLSVWQKALTIDDFKGMVSRSKNIKKNNDNYKENLAEIRSNISHLNIDLKMVRLHEGEEADLSKKHAEEIRILKEKGAGREELQSVEEIHKKEEKKLLEMHEREERILIHDDGRKIDTANKTQMKLVWVLLFSLMIVAFASRIVNLSVSPKFFEFDPYFDMMSTQWILTYGYQPAHDHSAWPILQQGSNHRIQPIVPYLEAFWYQLETNNKNSINISLLSKVSGVYPPLMAALLVFVVFMFVYHEYGSFEGLIAAALTTFMPVLITTFIAGEQLLEPWGIMTLFFFFAAYLLAVKNPKEKRYAILAGLAFVSTFLGAHYYTVDTGILALYIMVQGIISVLKRKGMMDFYKMNLIVLITITIFYALYDPYGGSLTNRIPAFLGIPTIIAFPLFALIVVAIFEQLPILLNKRGFIGTPKRSHYITWLAILVIAMSLVIFFTPIGKPIKSYINLSKKFTTPSSPLFMTVQEYTPTGPNFNFGSQGFGIIAASIGGVNIIMWLVIAAFVILELYEILFRDSQTGILSLVFVGVLAAAGLSEVKYLPHFGVAYIIAISLVIGAVYSRIKTRSGTMLKYAALAIILLILVGESTAVIYTFKAAGNTNCNTIAQNQNVIGYNLFCNSLTDQWLSALSWMKANIGPYAPRVLSWWDYGDWINWFGNSNAVIRGDNAVASFDYAVASQYVLGINDSYGPSSLAHFMNTQQTRYVIFDNQLTPKWPALDFLACVNINETSQAYAFSVGQSYGLPYLTGTSQCEYTHDPVDINVPINPSLNEICSFSNSTMTAVKSLVTIGETIPELLNTTYCVGTTPSSNGMYPVYNTNGTNTNIVLSPTYYLGSRLLLPNSKEQFADFMALYLPNGPNDTVTNAPTYFYNSNYYRGYFLGKLEGFTLVYPTNFTGTNLNSTQQVMIYELNNYTGTLPAVTSKPSWMANNYSVPG
jgi:asparagine N-glycosylation enzyme membrane subunit Stt3